MADEAAFGHYMKQGDCWEPVTAESSECFKAVINDDRLAVEQAVLKDPSLVSRSLLLLYWTTQQQNPDGNGTQDTTAAAGDDPASPAAEPTNRSAVYVKHRSLLMLASYHHSLKVVALLLSTDADPYKRSPDGLSCFDFVDANPTLSITAPTVRALLQLGSGEQRPARGSGCIAPDKDGSASSATQAKQDVVLAGTGRDCEAGERPVARWESSEGAAMQADAGGASPRAAHKIVPSKSGIPEDMNAPEYTTDEFRMFGFKVVKCNKRFQHDWTACPFAHPTENARRRDPRVFRYCSTPCPSYKQGLCMRGDSCPFAHGVFECWLHPSRYKTQLCKDADRCKRKVCFFAHSMDDLRHPTHTWEPTEEDVVACMVLPNLDTAESASSASSWLSNDSKRSMPKEGVADRAWEESRSMPSSPTGRRSPSHRSAGGMNRSATGGVQLLKSALAVLPRQGSGRMGVSNADMASTWTAGRSNGSDSPVSGETTREAPTGLSSPDGTFNIPAFYDSRATMPRMSNALARMIGVDGKDGGADVIQKLTSKVSLARVSSGPRVMPLLPTETVAPMMKGANRQQKMLLEQKDLLHTAASNASDEVASQLVGLATRGSGAFARTETQPTSQGDRLGNVELDNRGAAAVDGAQDSS